MRLRITARAIRHLQPNDRGHGVAAELADTVVPGLRLRAHRAYGEIRHTFYFRYRNRRTNLKKLITIGLYPATTLAAARKVAAEYRRQLGNGLDPQTIRRRDIDRLRGLHHYSVANPVADSPNELTYEDA
jgi:hypothetical protein